MKILTLSLIVSTIAIAADVQAQSHFQRTSAVPYGMGGTNATMDPRYGSPNYGPPMNSSFQRMAPLPRPVPFGRPAVGNQDPNPYQQTNWDASPSSTEVPLVTPNDNNANFPSSNAEGYFQPDPGYAGGYQERREANRAMLSDLLQGAILGYQAYNDAKMQKDNASRQERMYREQVAAQERMRREQLALEERLRRERIDAYNNAANAQPPQQKPSGGRRGGNGIKVPGVGNIPLPGGLGGRGPKLPF